MGIGLGIGNLSEMLFEDFEAQEALRLKEPFS